ncbi:hypothetical protein [Legionella spiritensis]|uniref:Uncharacterized protein n=1 Tax=Legionella spiritensis TaxID=452 RepID=A0A0W0YXL7_LEGSP|nr:hypothetical protein [Legionella spiritensis]KTD61358.1 hypothetical protein Lspi_2600 [Legionella spiritensis]SNV33785.1 Uncharacterised protein [Legionella spiritensis]
MQFKIARINFSTSISEISSGVENHTMEDGTRLDIHDDNPGSKESVGYGKEVVRGTDLFFIIFDGRDEKTLSKLEAEIDILSSPRISKAAVITLVEYNDSESTDNSNQLRNLSKQYGLKYTKTSDLSTDFFLDKITEFLPDLMEKKYPVNYAMTLLKNDDLKESEIARSIHTTLERLPQNGEKSQAISNLIIKMKDSLTPQKLISKIKNPESELYNTLNQHSKKQKISYVGLQQGFFSSKTRSLLHAENALKGDEKRFNDSFSADYRK